MRNFVVLTLLCLFPGLVANAQTKFKLADVLQSNMVVQQKKSFKIWGTAKPGSVVSVEADWTKPLTVSADDQGKFIASVSVPVAKKGDFTSHAISIKNEGQATILSNLLIGDVWLCSGQSNMQFKVQEDKNAATELPAANYPNIRLFSADLNFSAEPISTINGKWQACTPESVKNFSAAGYFFGKTLYHQLDIPIGLIFSGIGASKVEAFIPQDVLAADKALDSAYLKPYLNSPKSKETIDGGFSFEKVMRPYLLYNAMIHPLINLSLTGVCWYQGESNRDEREVYTLATQAMISTWRERFGQGDLPFYYIQVAPYYYEKEDPDLNDYAFFREAQERVATLKNTAMVVSMDVGEAKDLHPKEKRALGIRLAKTALNLHYGMDTVVYKGPHCKSMQVKGNIAVIYFNKESVKGGLSTNDGKAPRFFTIAGADGVFHDAQAKIVGQTVVVSSDKVQQPIAVRYAFTNYPVTNFQNANGLPAVPFRTDNWPEKR